MSGCGGCGKTRKKEARSCPLCGGKSGFIHPWVVQSVVRAEIKPFIVEEAYYFCSEETCDLIFFDQNQEQMLLAEEIDLQADFDSVVKEEGRSCDTCGGCAGGRTSSKPCE